MRNWRFQPVWRSAEMRVPVDTTAIIAPQPAMPVMKYSGIGIPEIFVCRLPPAIM